MLENAGLVTRETLNDFDSCVGDDADPVDVKCLSVVDPRDASLDSFPTFTAQMDTTIEKIDNIRAGIPIHRVRHLFSRCRRFESPKSRDRCFALSASRTSSRSFIVLRQALSRLDSVLVSISARISFSQNSEIAIASAPFFHLAQITKKSCNSESDFVESCLALANSFIDLGAMQKSAQTRKPKKVSASRSRQPERS
jgi:hypothetical protein